MPVLDEEISEAADAARAAGKKLKELLELAAIFQGASLDLDLAREIKRASRESKGANVANEIATERAAAVDMICRAAAEELNSVTFRIRYGATIDWIRGKGFEVLREGEYDDGKITINVRW